MIVVPITPNVSTLMAVSTVHVLMAMKATVRYVNISMNVLLLIFHMTVTTMPPKLIMMVHSNVLAKMVSMTSMVMVETVLILMNVMISIVTIVIPIPKKEHVLTPTKATNAVVMKVSFSKKINLSLIHI